MRWLVVFVSLIGTTQAQNLLPDGGFETLLTCPVGAVTDSKIQYLQHWSSPSIGTPDCYHVCNKGLVSVPNNVAGNAFAKEGNGYVGLALHVQPEPYYAEYIQSVLTTPLVKDSFYCISLYYRLASNSEYGMSGLGIHLSASHLIVNHNHNLVLKPAVVNKLEPNEQDADSWLLLEGIYKASGNEQYLVIGYFGSESTSPKRLFLPNRQSIRPTAYYYIDQVSVQWIQTNAVYKCSQTTYNFSE
ncbi:MAG: hypothetical protein MUE96_03245 [Bacteroidia bacterium]|jgi:hypothetical protein|nr:hypothetical protein [Bacteroidia bacterium]